METIGKSVHSSVSEKKQQQFWLSTLRPHRTYTQCVASQRGDEFGHRNHTFNAYAFKSVMQITVCHNNTCFISVHIHHLNLLSHKFSLCSAMNAAFYVLQTVCLAANLSEFRARKSNAYDESEAIF